MRVFAAGTLTNVMTIEVTWRSGKQSVVRGVKANCICEIDEAAATAPANSEPRVPSAPPPPFFKDVSELLSHTHEENTQALNKVGMVSAAVWSDLNGDGFPELILACEWGPLRVFQNSAGKLREVTAELGLDKSTGWWSGVK